MTSRQELKRLGSVRKGILGTVRAPRELVVCSQDLVVVTVGDRRRGREKWHMNQRPGDEQISTDVCSSPAQVFGPHSLCRHLEG